MKNARITSISIFLLIFTLTLTALLLGVSAEETSPTFTATPEEREIPVVWSIGYVGSAGNKLGNENKLGPVGGSSSYRHTNVITIAKAGTRITFTEKGNGDKGYCASTGYYLSSWKLENGQWVLDTEGANYQGSSTGKSEGHAKRIGDTMMYEYVTSKDNEQLRFCYCATGDKVGDTDVHPKIYAQFTGAQGTYALELERDNLPFYFEYDEIPTEGALYSGYIRNVNWQSGYVGSELNKDFYVNEIRPYADGYRYTSIINVPHAGTTLTFTDPDEGYIGEEMYFISHWMEVADGVWICDGSEEALTGDSDRGIELLGTSCKYTYTTTKDNECIRFCYKFTDATLPYPTVLWSSSNDGYSTETEPPETESIPSDSTPETEPSEPSETFDIARAVKLSLTVLTFAAFLAAAVILPRIFGDKNSSSKSGNGKSAK